MSELEQTVAEARAYLADRRLPQPRTHDLCMAVVALEEELQRALFNRLHEQLQESDAADEHEGRRGESVADRASRVLALINAPEIDRFLRGVHLEAVHQVERWGTAHDRAKRPADWFWLVGYLAGKALHASVADDRQKALHHCISTAAALYHWHCAIAGTNVHMCPGSSDVARIVDGAFPGEADVPPTYVGPTHEVDSRGHQVWRPSPRVDHRGANSAGETPWIPV